MRKRVGSSVAVGALTGLVLSLLPLSSASAVDAPEGAIGAASAGEVTDGTITAAIEGRWVAPDGCGNYLVRYSGLGDEDFGTIGVVDAASGRTIDSQLLSSSKPPAGLFSMQLCDFQVKDVKRFRLVLDFFGSSEVRSEPFTWQTNPPPAPKAKALPGRVSLGPITVETDGIWPRPTDGCGSYLVSLSGMSTEDIGSIRLIDATTRKVVDQNSYFGPVGNDTGSLSVCDFHVTRGQVLVLQVESFELGLAEGDAFTWQSQFPTPATPQALPARVTVGPITVVTTGDWSKPTKSFTCRDFTFDYIGWDSDIIGSVSLVDATTRRQLAFEAFISEPSSGTGTLSLCDFTVKDVSRMVIQVTGSGLGVVESPVFTWKGANSASIIITGSRTVIKGKPGIRIDGTVSGLRAGTKLAPTLKVGSAKAKTLKANITVGANSKFTWVRAVNKRSTVVIQTADGTVTSNPVTVNPR